MKVKNIEDFWLNWILLLKYFFLKNILYKKTKFDIFQISSEFKYYWDLYKNNLILRFLFYNRF